MARVGAVSYQKDRPMGRLSSDNVRQQPPFGRGVFGGIPLKPKSKSSEILDGFSLI
jgi:hypothetical protein